ncbi:MAG: N-acetyltransferase [Proteobacteria bacterium]|nr:N-acetyltransferase [Pseudomonadota bacterium]
MDHELTIHDDPRRQRFEAIVDGHASRLDYEVEDGVMVIVHTEVPSALQGRGIAGALVRHACEAARARGLQVEPRCDYAATWLRRHPEYADLVVAHGGLK